MRLYIDTAHCSDDSNAISWYQYHRFAEAVGALLDEQIPVIEGGELDFSEEGLVLYHANWTLHPDAIEDVPEDVRARFILLQAGRNDMDQLLTKYTPFGLIEQHGYDNWSADGGPGDWSGLVLPEHLAAEGWSKTGLSEATPYAMVPPDDTGLPAILVRCLGL